MGHCERVGARRKSTEWAREESKPRRRIVSSAPKAETRTIPTGEFEREVLIVASKLKKYVKDKHDLNTSGNVMERLSDLVRDLVDDAVIRARQEGRKTLMDRDF